MSPHENMIGVDRPLAIDVRDLVVARGEHVVLEDLNLRVVAGETVAILGANGAGKTTFFRCLSGLLQPRAGEIRLYGRSPYRNRDVRRFVGVIGHEPLVYAALTPLENLQLAAALCDVDQSGERIDELLTQTGLTRHAQRPTSELSCGLRQRLSIARALVHRPTILLLDEPSSGLDEQGRHWLYELLSQLRHDGATVCLATHDRSLARELADRLLRLENRTLSEMTNDGEQTAWAEPNWAATA